MQPVAVAVVPDLGQKPDPTELRRSTGCAKGLIRGLYCCHLWFPEFKPFVSGVMSDRSTNKWLKFPKSPYWHYVSPQIVADLNFFW